MKLIVYILPLLIALQSCNNERADKNALLIDSIKVGMKTKQVRKIIGKPIYLLEEPLNEDSVIIYVYDSPWGMSDNYEVRIRLKDSTVIGVGRGD